MYSKSGWFMFYTTITVVVITAIYQSYKYHQLQKSRGCSCEGSDGTLYGYDCKSRPSQCIDKKTALCKCADGTISTYKTGTTVCNCND